MGVRNLGLVFKNQTTFLDTLYSIIKGYFLSSTTKINRFGSFCEIYDNSDVHFYVNGYGRNYFHDVYEELIKAKKDVFINDWFFSPKIHLKRPCEINEETRIDRVLTKLARRGVKIYLIIYREVEGALYNASNYVQ